MRRSGVSCDGDLGRSRNGGGSQELLPERFKLRLTFATPKAEVPHLVNALRPDVLKEAPEKLVALELHRTLYSTIAIGILEEHVPVGDIQDAVVVQRPAIQ